MIELTKSDIELLMGSMDEMVETHNIRADEGALNRDEWSYEKRKQSECRALYAKLRNASDRMIVLSPFDYDVADKVFSSLFLENCRSYERDDGLTEIPAASYQMVVSALELFLWEVKDAEERKSIKQTIGIVQNLRDKQKMREWKRKGASA